MALLKEIALGPEPVERKAYNGVDVLAILTRPQGRNEPLAKRLEALGIDSLVMPALCIQPEPYRPAVFPHPGNYDLVVFVSGTAVRLYLRQLAQVVPIEPWPGHVLAATVGQASAQVLYDGKFVPRANVLHPDIHASHQDSEALWTVLEPFLPRLARVLIVRGQDGRDWLANRLERAGCRVDKYAVYRRRAQPWSAAQADLLKTRMASSKAIICLVTSGQSAAAVRENVDRHRLDALWQHVRFVTIHPRVASRLQSLFASGADASGRYAAVCAPQDAEIAHAIEVAAS